MCGICGIYYFKKDSLEPGAVESMMAGMRHRGPDDSGIMINGKCDLGFVRLSIIDLTKNANQPMTDSSGRYTMVFNGEIYNYIEIRKLLEKVGILFRTNSDSEVLLYSYIKWGIAALDYFNGMFAFAVYDNLEKKLLLARDRYGIKPLYYHINGKYLVFCSELPPMIDNIPGLKHQNNEAIYNYLVFNRTDYDDTTFFNGVKRLQHGHYAEIKDEMKITKWYNLKDRVANYNRQESFTDLFKTSIEYRLRSDVPVGLCLSGGLDSSAIASVLLRYFNKKDLNTFSAVFGDNFERDEKEYISEYENQFTNMFYASPSARTLFDDKEKFAAAHGEPVPTTSPYAQFKVMELASGNVKVTLDGQGADEQLAGYHYFFGNYYKELIYNFRLLKLLKEIYYYKKLHKSNYALKTFAYFLLPVNQRTKLRSRKLSYLQNDFDSAYRKDNFISGKLYESDTLMEALYNHFEYKLEHLLKWEDRNSMFFSIEARLPFLDYRIVEYCLSRNSDEIIRNGETKFLLRNDMKGILPEKIRNRQSKIGFDTPESDWFREDFFYNYVSDILTNSVLLPAYMNMPKAKELHELHMKGKTDISGDIWKWINLELWFKRFF
ncbi:MAG: asparagine synthase (glutamine-hydrolyzing) [Ignavibacteria bacterium]|jgi:asparagine synthase (glutamine-hydrolysing)|nr:asparagine synthase (glutamine-hydrolyzing) [Ignavibacteria bacterium]